MNSIEVKNLKKNYGPVEAVQGVSFDVRKGEIFGLIGPDGAGKTTIIRTIVSLLKATEGEVWFQGKNVSENPVYVRAHIGYMPQRFSLYQDLTVDENLDFFGNLFNVPKPEISKRKEELFAFSKLGPFKERRAAKLSGGMKQKLALSCMLIHQPETIVLDEPTFGVDPVSRQEFWDILKNLAERGTSILVSTAYMDEADLCSRVGLMFKGRMLATDTPQNLLSLFSEPLLLIESQTPNITYEQLERHFSTEEIHLFGDGIHFTDKQKTGIAGLKKFLQEKNISHKNIRKSKPVLEDVFLKLMR